MEANRSHRHVTDTMRLPDTANPPTNLSGEDAEILWRVQAPRRAMALPPIPLDLTLLHAPRIADGNV